MKKHSEIEANAVDSSETVNTKQETSKSDSTKRNQRRALVASIAAVGTASLPSQWKRPVVDSMLLPAHAQMSDVTGDDGDSGMGTTFTTSVTTTGSSSAITDVTCSATETFDYSLTTGSNSTGSTLSISDYTYALDRTVISECIDPLSQTSSLSTNSGLGFTNAGTYSDFNDISTFMGSGTTDYGTEVITSSVSYSTSFTTTVTSSA